MINPNKAICNKSYCNIQIKGVPVMADSNSLNYIGSSLLGKLYMKRFGNPLEGV